MKSKLYIAILAVGIFAALIAGCTHEPGVTPTSVTPNDTTTPTGTGICFERDILPIFISNCAKSGCHDAVTRAEGYVLTSYSTIVSKGIVTGNANASEIYEVLVENNIDKRMPQSPSPALATAQISLIKQWIDEGAKNGTGCAVLCDENVFTYQGAIQPMMNTYCKGCHNSASPSGGVVLDSYTGVKGIADNGKLVGVVKRLSGFSPMPQGGNSLSTCQITQIEKWIAAGTQNN